MAAPVINQLIRPPTSVLIRVSFGGSFSWDFQSVLGEGEGGREGGGRGGEGGEEGGERKGGRGRGGAGRGRGGAGRRSLSV